MTSVDNNRSTARWGAALLLVAAMLVAGIVVWRTLDDPAADDIVVAAPSGPPTIEELRNRAQADPDNPGVWQELGFAYFAGEEFDSAIDAYGRAVQLDPDSAVLWASLGEARIMASERDPMPQEAVQAFERALNIDPSDPRARYFMAVRKDLGGDHAGAIADWLDLLQDTPAGAPWESNLIRTIEQVGQINQIETTDRIETALAQRSPIDPGPEFTAGSAIPGPSREQIAAASALSPDEQAQMVSGMVESLESKLAADPSNVDGWVMLMRSRMTLGEPGRARDALRDALAANPSDAARLRSEAEQLGIR